MVITLIIAGLFVILLIIGKINLSIQFSREVNELFTQSKNISGKTFNYSQLDGLPEPVQRYFRHVLKEGQPFISYIRLAHDGQFKTDPDKRWMNIKGEQYFTAENPGFIWKGTVSMFTARDMFIAGKGRLLVSLLCLINIVDEQGKKIDEGELQRWLAESVWFPTNLLPSKRLQWSAIDVNTAKLTFNYKELAVLFLVTFNEAGEITLMETKRYMSKEGRKTWIGKLIDYREMNGIAVPTSIEATWKLEKGDYSYAKFNVREIEYNKPEIF